MKACSFRATLFAAVSLIAILPSGAQAQESPGAQGLSPLADQPPKPDKSASEIVVTGTRASLENAERVKRNSPVTVDGISADDISALPDQSISESLVRIPGLTANDGPRGPDLVSIRGLGPDLTLVTINGRILPSTAGGDRRISLAELPTEGISGAYVKKTTEASALEGAVAGTLDLQTIHPLDTSRHGLTLVARALYQDNADTLKAADHYSPFGARAEATYVNRFGSNFGIALSYAYLKQYTGFIGDQIDNWRLGTGPRADANKDGKPDALPTNVGVTSNYNDDNRHSFLGMAQWDVSPAVRLSLDGMFISDLLYAAPTRFFAANIYNGATLGAATSSTVNSSNSVEAFSGTTGLYREILNSQRQFDRFYGGGFNAVVHQGPFKANFDISIEEARRRNTQPQATIEDAGATALAQRQPFSYDISDPNHISINFAPLSADDYAMSQYLDSLIQVRDVIKAARADFAYQPAPNPILKSIAFGFKVDQQTHGTSTDNTLYNFASVAARPDLDGSYLQTSPNPFAAAAGGFGGPNSVNFPYFDITKLSPLKGAPGVIVHDQFVNDIAGTFRVIENTAAMYSQLNLESGPFSGNVGLRYVITDEKVNGATGTSAADLTPERVHNSYHYLLPAVNFRYALTPKLIGRLAYSETFARQQFDDLAISSAIDLSTVTNGVVSITRGNPNLKPFTSKAADVSMEWYPNRATSISVAGYIKFVNNFLIPSIENTTVTLRDGTTAPAVITSVVNDPKTTNLKGIEISARRDLDFLPGPLRNLGIAVNWNRNWTNIHQTAISLVGTTAPTTPDLTSRNVVNAQLYYSTRRLDLRLAFRYFDRYERAFFNSYQVQPGGQLDFSGGWTIHGNVRLIGSVTNITHARMRRYIPDSRDLSNTTLTQLSVYQGRVFTLGLRTTL